MQHTKQKPLNFFFKKKLIIVAFVACKLKTQYFVLVKWISEETRQFLGSNLLLVCLLLHTIMQHFTASLNLYTSCLVSIYGSVLPHPLGFIKQPVTRPFKHVWQWYYSLSKRDFRVITLSSLNITKYVPLDIVYMADHWRP